jgi:cytochrome c biogenesis protein CcmG/thiol:disulfide interchange protein DsbE
MLRKLLYLVPLAGFLALAGYFALALRPGYDPHALPSAMIDKPGPDFVLPALDGKGDVTAESLRGQVVVINFFASWCVPCREENPILMRLAQQDRVPLYGIAYKDSVEDSRRVLQQFGDPYRRIAVDRDGRTGLDYGVYGVPETYVIDKAGRIRKKFTGPLEPATVQNELLPLLRQLNQS